MSYFTSCSAASFFDPISLHREALKSCQLRFVAGEYDHALGGLRAFFTAVSKELAQRELSARGQISRSVEEGLLSESLVPLAASFLPPASNERLQVATAPYREILADAYRLAGGIHSRLGQASAAARAHGQEIEVRLGQSVTSDESFSALMDAFFLKCDAHVEALELSQVDKQLALAKDIGRRFAHPEKPSWAPSPWSSNEPVVDPLTREFLQRGEEYREYLNEFRGMVLRLEALEHSFPLRALSEPVELEEDVRSLRAHTCRRRENGDLLPKRVAERLALLTAAAGYITARAQLGDINQAVSVVSEVLCDVSSGDGQQALKIIRSGLCAMAGDIGRIDDGPYAVPFRPGGTPPHYLLEVLLASSSDVGLHLMKAAEYRRARVTYDWIKRLLSDMQSRVSPQAVVIHLNDSDAAFRDEQITAAANEAATAQALVLRLLGQRPPVESSVIAYQSQALLRLGLCEQYRYCQVPRVVALISSLPSNARRQIWAADIVPHLRSLNMEPTWELLMGISREVTGSDQMLCLSGKHMPGVRIPLEEAQLDERLSAHFRRNACKFFSDAALRAVDDQVRVNATLASRMLRDATRRVPALELIPLEL